MISRWTDPFGSSFDAVAHGGNGKRGNRLDAGLEARVGFEPTNGGFANQSWISILLVRLAFTPAHLADFGPYLRRIVPKLFPTDPTAPLG